MARRKYKRKRSYSTARSAKRVYKALKDKSYLRGPGTPHYIKYGPSARQIAMTGAEITPEQQRARFLDNYRGDGDYRDWAKWIPRGIGGIWGGLSAAAANPMDLGRMVSSAQSGWGAGADISRALGWGDYTVPRAGNQIVAGGGVDSQTPTFLNASDLSGDVYISHREFVGNITVPAGSDGSFSIQKFNLKPVNGPDDNQVTFPWLKAIASNFELYKWQGLMFQYIPTYGEFGGDDKTLGKVIMATNYDPLAVDFESEVQMQNYDYAHAVKPSVGMVHGVETALSQTSINMLYIDDGEVDRDPLFQTLGNHYVATSGIPNAGGSAPLVVGELWVTYRIKLSRARLALAQPGVGFLQRVLADGPTSGTSWSGPNNIIEQGGTDLVTPLEVTTADFANIANVDAFKYRFSNNVVGSYVLVTAKWQVTNELGATGAVVLSSAQTSEDKCNLVAVKVDVDGTTATFVGGNTQDPYKIGDVPSFQALYLITGGNATFAVSTEENKKFTNTVDARFIMEVVVVGTPENPTAVNTNLAAFGLSLP